MNRETLKWKFLRGLTAGTDIETLMGDLHDEVVQRCASAIVDDNPLLASRILALKLPKVESKPRDPNWLEDAAFAEPTNPVVGVRCNACGKRAYKRDWKTCEGNCPHCGETPDVPILRAVG